MHALVAQDEFCVLHGHTAFRALVERLGGQHDKGCYASDLGPQTQKLIRNGMFTYWMPSYEDIFVNGCDKSATKCNVCHITWRFIFATLPKGVHCPLAHLAQMFLFESWMNGRLCYNHGQQANDKSNETAIWHWYCKQCLHSLHRQIIMKYNHTVNEKSIGCVKNKKKTNWSVFGNKYFIIIPPKSISNFLFLDV